MSNSNLDKIKHLRDATGLSFDEIKKALDASDGDTEKAAQYLRERGVALAQKKSTREVKEGIVATYVHANKKLGAMVEVLCETDFVARNQDFQQLGHDLAMHVAAMKPGDVKELLEQPYVKNPDLLVKDLVNQCIAKLGENIQVSRFQLFEI